MRSILPNQQVEKYGLSRLPGLFEEKDSLAESKASHEEQLNKLYAEIGKLTTQVPGSKKKSGLEPQ